MQDHRLPDARRRPAPPPRRRSARRSARATRRRCAAVAPEALRHPPRQSSAPAPPPTPAPVLWRYESGARAFGIFVDEAALHGRQRGTATSPPSTTTARSAASSACPTGSSASSPTTPGSTPAATTATSTTCPARSRAWRTRSPTDIDIYWLDIHDGVLGVSDANGGITTIDHEDEFLWRAPGQRRARLDGALRRRRRLPRPLAGRDRLRAGAPAASCGTPTTRLGALRLAGARQRVSPARAPREVDRLSKSGGANARYRCDAAVFSCATAARRPYVFAGDSQLLDLLLRRGRHPAVEARHRLRLGATRCSTTTTGSTSSPPTARWPASTRASRRSARPQAGRRARGTSTSRPPARQAVGPCSRRRRGRPPTPPAAWSCECLRGGRRLRVRRRPPATDATGRSSSPRASASRAPATS